MMTKLSIAAAAATPTLRHAERVVTTSPTAPTAAPTHRAADFGRTLGRLSYTMLGSLELASSMGLLAPTTRHDAWR